MPYEIQLDVTPLGFAENAALPGDQVNVVGRQFVSTEDGDLFIDRLEEGLSGAILSKLPPDTVKPSQIDKLLVIIDPSLKCVIYINEFEFIGEVLYKGLKIDKGDPLFEDDIADVRTMKANGIDIPPTSAVIVLFSVGWRKGLYFDFLPLSTKKPRDYDLDRTLGNFFSYVMFQSLFKITAETWDRIIINDWFLFVRLSNDIKNKIVNNAKNKWNIDDLLPDIHQDLLVQLPKIDSHWENNEYMTNHLPILRQAIDRFKANDYASCISLLLPRIEGVLRDFHYSVSSERPTQKNLALSAVENIKTQINDNSLLMPFYFKTYLDKKYFADFDPANPTGLSRNTFSHGVAKPEEFSLKNAILSILTLNQLTFYFKKSV